MSGVTLYPFLDRLKLLAEMMGGQFFPDFTLIGIRNTEVQPGQVEMDGDAIVLRDELYDDCFVTVRRNAYRTGWQARIYQGVTGPGKHIRNNPYQGTSGAGVIVPGFYRSVYGFGKHGEYDALVQQQTRPFFVYRDGDGDDTLTLAHNSIELGGGFNAHRRRGDRYLVGGASGGCQVWLVEADFEEMLSDARKYNQGKTISYSLVNSHWLWDLDRAKQEFATIQQATARFRRVSDLA